MLNIEIIIMKRLILRLLIAILTFVFSYAMTWVTAYFSDEPAPDQIKAVRHIQAIGTAQLQYSVTKGKGKFADLETLGSEGLIDNELAAGKKDGYIFIAKPLQLQQSNIGIYDIIAKPISSAGKALLLYSNEANVVYQITDTESSQVSDQNRIPENGLPLQ
jgi:hypothetical protein